MKYVNIENSPEKPDLPHHRPWLRRCNWMLFETTCTTNYTIVVCGANIHFLPQDGRQ